MPGTKWKRSLKRPAMYEKLRKKGMSKSKAARISNAAARRARGRARRRK